MKIIARIYNDFDEKFGIPRQSGRIAEVLSEIVFEKEYNNPLAVRGIEQFSHLWLIWEFSENKEKDWSPTVRPPRLGGNKRVGVFASRSPFRPNPIGLSCVKLEEVKTSKKGISLIVSGADILNGTPIYDIKPYIPYSDCQNDALGGYAQENCDHKLNVNYSKEIKDSIDKNTLDTICKLLSDDPRPSYQNNSERIYGMSFKGLTVKFKATGENISILSIN